MANGPLGAHADPARAPARRPVAVSRTRTAIAALIAVAAFASLVVFGLRLYEEVKAFRVAPRDNVQWSLSQLEVDLLMFATAAERAEDGEVPLSEVRRRYDIFFSRVGILARGAVFADLRAEEETKAPLTRLEDFLARWQPVIDGPDNRLRRALPVLENELIALREDARDLSLRGIAVFADKSDDRRRVFERILLIASLFAVGLILALGAMLVALVRQYDTSVRRAAEVERSRRRLAATFDTSLDAIIVANADGRIVDVNKAAEELFGYGREATIGAEMGALIVPERYRDAHRRGMARYLATGSGRVVGRGRIEMSAIRADGTEFPVELSIGEAEGEAGPIFIGYLRDISARLAAQRELMVARDAAMAGDRAKSQFIAVMSHEMRTPLNGVLGILDLLKTSGLDPDQERYVDVAIASGEVLARHVDDVLDITRIEAGELVLDKKPLDLSRLVAEVADIARAAAEANGNAISWTVDVPNARLAGDPHRIRQILINLVGNAAKFTVDGSISITASVRSEDPDGADVEFAVADNGIGIAKADHDRIFEDFVTLDPGYDRAAGGSGLGLAICRRLVDAMGGEIGVESAPGTGSRFWVRLRLERADAPSQAAEHASAWPAPGPGRSATTEAGLCHRADGGPPRAWSILLVEDNETNRLVARAMLARRGHRVTEAHDGLDGVEKALAERFDLILMDISMPRLDGVEATRRIRSGGGPNAATPIVGLTAHALPEEQRHFHAAGMQDCLVKPIRLDKLQGTFEALELARRADAEPEAPNEVRRTGADRGPADGKEAVDAQKNDRSEEDADHEDVELLDAEVLSEVAASLTAEALHRLLERVCSDIDDMTPRIVGAASERAFPATAAHAHKLAGSAALVGAVDLHRVLAAIEAAAKRGAAADVDRAVTMLADLAPRTRSVLGELAEDA